MRDSLGDRIKSYENVTRTFLYKRTPAIIRIDGKAFHTFTKRFEKPFSDDLHQMMVNTMTFLVNHIQNAAFAYTQSDEISILLNDWKTLTTEQWFNGNIQKITSVSASFATGRFNADIAAKIEKDSTSCLLNNLAFFDSRVFNLSKEEVVNYFIWRQIDAERNSIQMLARHYFTHKQLIGKNTQSIKQMLTNINVSWENDCKTWQKRGTAIYKSDDKWHTDENIPRFIEQRDFIDQYLDPR